ncbi:MAG TPA: ATP-binding protein [Azospirillaceae bacterium]|nr:ATP-binding protein [Azospirillaceae bacterium]
MAIEWLDTLLDFGRTLAILTLVVFAHAVMERASWRRIGLGLVYGAVGVFGMATPIVLTDGFLFDLRAAVIGLATLFSGPLSGTVATVCLAGYRLWLGGGGVWIGLAAIGLAYAVATALWVVHRRDPAGADEEWLVASGILLSGTGLIFLALVLPDGPGALGVLGPQAAMNFVAMLVVGSILIARRQARTAREQAQQLSRDLRSEQALIATLMEGWPDAVFVKDLKGRFTAANEALARIFGLPGKEALIGRRLADVYPDVPLIADQMDAEVLSTGCPIVDQLVERCIAGPDGEKVTFFFRTTRLPLRDSQGAIIGLVGISRDVTRQVADRRELEEAKAAAEIASRAKSEFLASMSHELRTPLNAIIGFGEMIAEERLGPVGVARYKEYGADIARSASHLRQLIDELLDLARIEAGRLELREETLPVREEVEAALRLIAGSGMAEGLNLDTAPIPDGLFLHADARAFRQILLNLLSNAAKYTQPGGRITVRTEADPDGGLRLVVEDTGAGISPDRIGELGHPFARGTDALTRQHRGFGLGLYITRMLVERHGGTLTLESELGCGTRAAVRFPPDRIKARVGAAAAIP